MLTTVLLRAKRRRHARERAVREVAARLHEPRRVYPRRTTAATTSRSHRLHRFGPVRVHQVLRLARLAERLQRAEHRHLVDAAEVHVARYFPVQVGEQPSRVAVVLHLAAQLAELVEIQVHAAVVQDKLHERVLQLHAVPDFQPLHEQIQVPLHVRVEILEAEKTLLVVVQKRPHLCGAKHAELLLHHFRELVVAADPRVVAVEKQKPRAQHGAAGPLHLNEQLLDLLLPVAAARLQPRHQPLVLDLVVVHGPAEDQRLLHLLLPLAQRLRALRVDVGERVGPLQQLLQRQQIVGEDALLVEDVQVVEKVVVKPRVPLHHVETRRVFRLRLPPGARTRGLLALRLARCC
mmetsp:Transcript_26380/g.66534  ORF Transcript_26380/g.66534 Transcript_26380/m.66534 type:complete len:349 (-) Transcript_26380:3559-4605(-)